MFKTSVKNCPRYIYVKFLAIFATRISAQNFLFDRAVIYVKNITNRQLQGGVKGQELA